MNNHGLQFGGVKLINVSGRSRSSERGAIVGQRIKAAREKLRMSQVSVSRAVGLTDGACRQWESGKNLPRMETLEKVSHLLEVTTDWLLNGDGSAGRMTVATNKEREMLDAFRELTPAGQAAAKAILDALPKAVMEP